MITDEQLKSCRLGRAINGKVPLVYTEKPIFLCPIGVNKCSETQRIERLQQEWVGFHLSFGNFKFLRELEGPLFFAVLWRAPFNPTY